MAAFWGTCCGMSGSKLPGKLEGTGGNTLRSGLDGFFGSGYRADVSRIVTTAMNVSRESPIIPMSPLRGPSNSYSQTGE